MIQKMLIYFIIFTQVMYCPHLTSLSNQAMANGGTRSDIDIMHIRGPDGKDHTLEMGPVEIIPKKGGDGPSGGSPPSRDRGGWNRSPSTPPGNGNRPNDKGDGTRGPGGGDSGGNKDKGEIDHKHEGDSSPIEREFNQWFNNKDNGVSQKKSELDREFNFHQNGSKKESKPKSDGAFENPNLQNLNLLFQKIPQLPRPDDILEYRNGKTSTTKRDILDDYYNSEVMGYAKYLEDIAVINNGYAGEIKNEITTWNNNPLPSENSDEDLDRLIKSKFPIDSLHHGLDFGSQIETDFFVANPDEYNILANINLLNPITNTTNNSATYEYRTMDIDFRERLKNADLNLQKANPDFEQGIEAKELAKKSLQGADYFSMEGDQDTAEFLLNGAIALTDIALGVIPGVGLAKDIYEAALGISLLTGNTLDTMDRSFAVLGILTLGYGDKIGAVFKGLRKIGRKLSAEMFDNAEMIYKSAAKLGVKTGEKVKSFALSFKTNPKAIENVEEIATNIAKSPSAVKAFEQTPMGRPAFYVNAGGKAVPATAYRHFGSDSVEFVKESIAKTGKIPEHPGAGNYLTFEKIDNAAQASDLLQVKHDARFRVTVDTLENVNDIVVPHGKWGTAEWLEPITKDMIEYGDGGASQAVTNKVLPGVLEVKDLVTGEILFKK